LLLFFKKELLAFPLSSNFIAHQTKLKAMLL